VATRKNVNVTELPSGRVKAPFLWELVAGVGSVVSGIRVVAGTITKQGYIVKRNVTISPVIPYRTLV
jgi:hypothetical protein